MDSGYDMEEAQSDWLNVKNTHTQSKHTDTTRNVSLQILELST